MNKLVALVVSVLLFASFLQTEAQVPSGVLFPREQVIPAYGIYLLDYKASQLGATLTLLSGLTYTFDCTNSGNLEFVFANASSYSPLTSALVLLLLLFFLFLLLFLLFLPAFRLVMRTESLSFSFQGTETRFVSL